MAVMQTERLIIRPWTMDENDLDGYADMRMDDEVAVEAGWFSTQEPDICESWLEDEIGRENCWAIVLRENNRTVGYIDLHEDVGRKGIPGVMAVGFALVQDSWGQGIMTEALGAVQRHAFEELKLEQVSADHYAGNEACRRTLERCGFQYEGRKRRSSYHIDCGWADDEYYSILKAEYFARKNGSQTVLQGEHQ